MFPSQRILALLLVALFIGFFPACKPLGPPKPPLVQTVAILPFDSESNNLNAPDILQKLVYETLKKSPYQVSDIEATNQFLAGKGIVDGGQLAVADPVKIAKDLGVQGLMYGNVASFGYANVGFYAQRKVSLELRLVDGLTGQTLWENTGTETTANFADKDKAVKNFTKNLADQAIDKALKNPLAEESRLATLEALQTLPGAKIDPFAFFEVAEEKNNSGQNKLKNFIIK